MKQSHSAVVHEHKRDECLYANLELSESGQSVALSLFKILHWPCMGKSWHKSIPRGSRVHLWTLLARIGDLSGLSFHHKVKSPLIIPALVVGKTSESQNRVILQDLDQVEVNEIHLLYGPEYFQLHLLYHSKELKHEEFLYFISKDFPSQSCQT